MSCTSLSLFISQIISLTTLHSYYTAPPNNQDAKFGASGINVGLFCSTPAVALSRNIHRKHAMQMLLTGNFITAKEALSYGLVNKVVAPDDLQPETSKLAATIAGKSNYAVRLGKKMFYEQLQYRDLKEAYKFATEQIVCNINNYDTQRGINEFLNRPNQNLRLILRIRK